MAKDTRPPEDLEVEVITFTMTLNHLINTLKQHNQAHLSDRATLSAYEECNNNRDELAHMFENQSTPTKQLELEIGRITDAEDIRTLTRNALRWSMTGQGFEELKQSTLPFQKFLDNNQKCYFPSPTHFDENPANRHAYNTLAYASKLTQTINNWNEWDTNSSDYKTLFKSINERASKILKTNEDHEQNTPKQEPE